MKDASYLRWLYREGNIGILLQEGNKVEIKPANCETVRVDVINVKCKWVSHVQ